MYCRECGQYLEPDAAACPAGHAVIDYESLFKTVNAMATGMQVQTRQASSLVEGLVASQLIPVVDVLDKWWLSLGDKHQQQFAVGLLARLVAMTHNGHFDSLLSEAGKELLGASGTGGHRAERVARTLLGQSDAEQSLYTALGQRLGKQLEDGYGSSPFKQLVESVREEVATAFAQRYAESEYAELASLVKDKLPSPDELAKIVADKVVAAKEAEVREALAKKG